MSGPNSYWRRVPFGRLLEPNVSSGSLLPDRWMRVAIVEDGLDRKRCLGEKTFPAFNCGAWNPC